MHPSFFFVFNIFLIYRRTQLFCRFCVSFEKEVMKTCLLILPLLSINHSLDTCSLYIVLTHEVWMSAVSVTAASNTLAPFSVQGKGCFWSFWCQRSRVHPKSSSCIGDAYLFYIKAIRWWQSAGRWVGIVGGGGLLSLWPAEGSVVNEERTCMTLQGKLPIVYVTGNLFADIFV